MSANEYLKLRDYAELKGVSAVRVRYWIAEGKLAPEDWKKVCGVYFIKKSVEIIADRRSCPKEKIPNGFVKVSEYAREHEITPSAVYARIKNGGFKPEDVARVDRFVLIRRHPKPLEWDDIFERQYYTEEELRNSDERVAKLNDESR